MITPIAIRWPWAVAAGPAPPPPPDPGVLVRLVAVERALEAAFADRERQAQTIATLITRIEEQDRTIASLQRAIAAQAEESERRLSAQRRILDEEREKRAVLEFRLTTIESEKAHLANVLIYWQSKARDLEGQLRAAGLTPAGPPLTHVDAPTPEPVA